MSRVDEDRQADQISQRRLQEQQRAEAKSKQTKESATFSKLVQKQQTETKTQQKEEPRQTLAQQVLARVKEGPGQQQGTTGRQEAKHVDERVHTQQSSEAERMSSGQQADATRGEQMTADRKSGQGTTEARAESRTTESRTEGDAKADERSAAMRSAGRSAMKGQLKSDADSGGGGQGSGSGKDNKQGGEAAAAAGFRFNPALMAPPPVAKPKPSTGSDRLRALAQEIAQKIVDRVRVGTNGAGQSEFQIDLRSDVLSGLSIKISAKNGKISAVFSGSDRDVLKMIEGQSEGLKSALQGRGLKLEALRFEARA